MGRQGDVDAVGSDRGLQGHSVFVDLWQFELLAPAFPRERCLELLAGIRGYHKRPAPTAHGLGFCTTTQA